MGIPEIEIDGDAFRAAREELGLSRNKVALALDITYDTVQNWEIGRNTPPPRTVARIAEIIGIRPDEYIRPTPMGRLKALIDAGEPEEAVALVREMCRGNGVEVLGTGGVRLPADVVEALRDAPPAVWPARGQWPVPEPARPARRMTGRELRERRGERGRGSA